MPSHLNITTYSPHGHLSHCVHTWFAWFPHFPVLPSTHSTPFPFPSVPTPTLAYPPPPTTPCTVPPANPSPPAMLDAVARTLSAVALCLQFFLCPSVAASAILLIVLVGWAGVGWRPTLPCRVAGGGNIFPAFCLLCSYRVIPVFQALLHLYAMCGQYWLCCFLIGHASVPLTLLKGEGRDGRTGGQGGGKDATFHTTPAHPLPPPPALSPTHWPPPCLDISLTFCPVYTLRFHFSQAPLLLHIFTTAALPHLHWRGQRLLDKHGATAGITPRPLPGAPLDTLWDRIFLHYTPRMPAPPPCPPRCATAPLWTGSTILPFPFGRLRKDFRPFLLSSWRP